jgi:hypothetical protein
MMARKRSSKKNIDVEMGTAGLEVRALLEQIGDLAMDLPAPESRGLNWGHVGTMKHVQEQLTDIRDSLAGTGEYAEEGGVA